MFNIDFRRLIYNLLPHFLRKAGTLAYLYSAVYPIKLLNTIFVSFRDNTLYRLLFSGQTIYLEHYLNDQYDPVGRGIFISNINTNPYNYFFNVGENYPANYVYNTVESIPYYLNNYAEVLAGDDFLINIPVAVVFDQLDLDDDVKTYAMAGVTWTIQTY